MNGSPHSGQQYPPPGNPRSPQPGAGASNPAAPPAPPGRVSLPSARPGSRRPGPHGITAAAGSGRDRSDDRPNTIRCRTARSARSLPISASRSASRSAAAEPASRSASRSASRALSARSRALIQRRSQHIPQRRLSTLRIRDNASRNRHAAQQTPSAAANHAPRASVSQPAAATASWTPTPLHTNSEYLRSVSRPRGHIGGVLRCDERVLVAHCCSDAKYAATFSRKVTFCRSSRTSRSASRGAAFARTVPAAVLRRHASHGMHGRVSERGLAHADSARHRGNGS